MTNGELHGWIYVFHKSGRQTNHSVNLHKILICIIKVSHFCFTYPFQVETLVFCWTCNWYLFQLGEWQPFLNNTPLFANIIEWKRIWTCIKYLAHFSYSESYQTAFFGEEVSTQSQVPVLVGPYQSDCKCFVTQYISHMLNLFIQVTSSPMEWALIDRDRLMLPIKTKFARNSWLIYNIRILSIYSCHQSTKENQKAKTISTYCSLILFSDFFTTLSADDFFLVARARQSSSFLLLINSENDGIGGSWTSWEGISIGKVLKQVCNLTLGWISLSLSLLIAVGPSFIETWSGLEVAFSKEKELVLELSLCDRSVEFVVDSHLTVDATWE